MLQKFYKWIGGIFRDESGSPSSKRFVGIMCAIALCATMYHNSFSTVDVAPAPYLVPVIIKNLDTEEEVRVDMSISVLGDVVREYVPIIKYDVESDYEVAKSNFLLSKQLLENIAGFTIGVNY